jgi:hypothetical protein
MTIEFEGNVALELDGHGTDRVPRSQDFLRDHEVLGGVLAEQSEWDQTEA